MKTEQVKVQPKETDELLANPDMGWETFHKFADEDPALAGLPSSVAYFRYYWYQVEPEDGRIDWEKLDGLLEHAHRAGQKLAFRVMTAGTSGPYMHSPQWLKDLGCPGYEYRAENSTVPHWLPDHDHPLFLDRHLRLIAALGRRYDGHPDFSHMDIGSVGFWGEWHHLQTGVPLPTEANRIRIIDAYLAAFKKTPLLMCLGFPRGVHHANEHGAGWRADCLGDMGGFSPTWNHMEMGYPKLIKEADAYEAWKTGPVGFESCWDMRRWKKEGWDIDHIFDYALNLHTTYLNNKSAPVPEGTRHQVERFLRRLGYRFTVRSVEHPASVAAGDELELMALWENVGVAPAYADYVASAGLGSTDGKVHALTPVKRTVRTWLPGKHPGNLTVQVPAGLPAGRYDLLLGVVDPGTARPVVKLANTGRRPDGWHTFSSVTVS